MRFAPFVMMMVVITGLGGCAHMPDMRWPWGEKESAADPAPTPPAEEIGPRVEAVPVEPVIAENMMTNEASAPDAATLPAEPFGF